MEIQKIFIGGWFQRTTLHLSEIYDFFKGEDTPLDLDKKKLKKLRDDIGIKKVEMIMGKLEYIDIDSKETVSFKIYEDGLIVLNTDSKNVSESIKKMTNYYEKKLSPGLSYIFSLGAPIPKELANIKTIYPYFVVLNKADESDIEGLLAEFKQEKHFKITNENFELYRGDKLYIINNKNESLKNIEKFVGEQIFIREFKGQLHRYLNLHRIIWEKIDEVKERGKMKGTEIGPFKSKIESYAKTINLIEARIDQMGAYIGTRESIVKSDPEFANFAKVLEYNYEKLSNTWNYMKVIWQMTKNYVGSAIALFTDLAASSTGKSIQDLTVITSMGVGASLINLFTGQPPALSWIGAIYFIVLAVIGYSVNKVMKLIYRSRNYEVSDVEIAKNIK